MITTVMHDDTDRARMTSLEAATDHPRTVTFVLMLLAGFLGLVASLVLSLDALVLAANPQAELQCTINSVFDCAAVANSAQSKVLGIPNAFLGLMLQPAIVAIAVAKLGGARMPRWYMAAFNALMLVAILHAHWLLFQSTFVIKALCLWCLTLLVCTVLVFVLLTRWNLLEGNLSVRGDGERGRAFVLGGWSEIALIAWFAIIIAVEAIVWVPSFL